MTNTRIKTKETTHCTYCHPEEPKDLPAVTSDNREILHLQRTSVQDDNRQIKS